MLIFFVCALGLLLAIAIDRLYELEKKIDETFEKMFKNINLFSTMSYFSLIALSAVLLILVMLSIDFNFILNLFWKTGTVLKNWIFS